MEKAHPYEEPAVPLPLCAFKFDASKFGIVRDAYELNRDAIEHFGVFEFDRPPYAKRLASSPEDFEKVHCFLSIVMQLVRSNLIRLNTYNFPSIII